MGVKEREKKDYKHHYQIWQPGYFSYNGRGSWYVHAYMVNSEERLAQTKSPPSTFKSFVSDTEAEQQPGVLSMFTQSMRASVSSNSCLTRSSTTYEGQSNYAGNLSSMHPCIRTQSYLGFEQCRIVPLRVCAELSPATNAMRKTLINKQCLNWPERIRWCVGSTPGTSMA